MDNSKRILPEDHTHINIDAMEHTDDDGLDDVIERLHRRRDSLLVQVLIINLNATVKGFEIVDLF